MFLLERLGRVSALLGALSLIVAPVRADDSTGAKEPFVPRTFAAALKNGEIVGREQVRRVFVTAGTNEFVFVVPEGLHMNATADKVTVASSDFSYFVTFRILGEAQAEGASLSSELCRRYVLTRFPGSRILEEYSKTAANRTGPAFEMEAKTLGGTKRFLCIGLVPSRAGILEFSLDANGSNVADAKCALNAILRTFSSNEGGKLEISVRVMDNS